jgi:chaperonin GroES
MNGQIVPMSVQAGDKVLLPSFGGQTIKIGEEEYALFRDAEILAKVTE